MSHYIHQLKDWPGFNWRNEDILQLLGNVRYLQGKLLGKMESLGFSLREEATLETLALDVLKSSEIEGEFLNRDQVRSSIAKRLGLSISGLVPADSNVDGVVEMMLDATQGCEKSLSFERLFGWHSALFPTGRSSMFKIVVGGWRKDETGPMQIVSGALGKEKVHYQAPEAKRIEKEMKGFIKWFNGKDKSDPVLKAAIAHLWFVTIHPFEDGNGRIARAITDMQLARADKSRQRFYSMSARIRKERKAYYDVLEKTQKGTLDVTDWIFWFLNCLMNSLLSTDKVLEKVLTKAKFWERNSSISLNERQKKIINKLLDDFEGKLNSSKYAKINKCSPDTALRDMNDLIEKKILRKEPAGGRSTSYILQ